MINFLRVCLCVAYCLSVESVLWAAESAPSNEIIRAEHFLIKFEQKVERMRGQSFRLGYEENEALKRVKSLHEHYPDDPAVLQLFERSRGALMASKGEFMQITQEMLTYRENEKKLKEAFGALADKEWTSFLDSIRETPDSILPVAFPPPDTEKVSILTLQDRYVLLDDFEYPTNQFFDLGREFVWVGSGTRGYYYVEIGSAGWLGAYEAFKRYRRLVNRSLPESGKWTLLGQISGVDMIIPQAEKVKTIAGRWGWIVQPVAIYVPGHVFAMRDSGHPEGGSFAGEEQMEAIKGPMYTVRAIPEDVTPERLVEIFSVAIKEKNYPLYLDCILPDRRKTRNAESLARYHWDLHLSRFAELYVHVTVDPAKVEVIRGYDEKGEWENYFLDEEQRATVGQISEALVEQATVLSMAWDERGRQYGSPKPHFLRRVDKGRWYIENYEQPF